MRISRTTSALIAALTAALSAAVGEAGVIEFTDRWAWQSAAEPFTEICFTEYPVGTLITNQYADLDVIFTDGNDHIFYTPSFVIDGYGIDGYQSIHLAFLISQRFIAVDFPGGMQIELYSNGQLIYTSSEFGGAGTGFFAGLASTEPFDEAHLTDWSGTEVHIDTLLFAVPAPPALALLALAASLPGRRRRAR